jgi:hypothetical protein
MNPREIALNKNLSEEISTKKNALEKKLKTKGKLTLKETITLEMHNLLISRGWGELPVQGQNIKRSDDESLINEVKQELIGLDRQELIHRLAVSILKIEDLMELVDKENDSEYQFLISKFEKSLGARIYNTAHKVAERKKGKAAIHEKKYEMAAEVIDQMRKNYQEIEASNAREFYQKLREKCAFDGIAAPSVNTLRNYFKALTGLESTK